MYSDIVFFFIFLKFIKHAVTYLVYIYGIINDIMVIIFLLILINYFQYFLAYGMIYCFEFSAFTLVYKHPFAYNQWYAQDKTWHGYGMCVINQRSNWLWFLS